MWKQLVEFSKQLVALTRDVQQGKDTLKTHSEELKEIRQELKRALELLQDLRYEQHRNRENAMHEREKLTLRLENILLRTGGRLLPPGDQKGQKTRMNCDSKLKLSSTKTRNSRTLLSGDLSRRTTM
jgi:chromosome segregation ATPase